MVVVQKQGGKKAFKPVQWRRGGERQGAELKANETEILSGTVPISSGLGNRCQRFSIKKTPNL